LSSVNFGEWARNYNTIREVEQSSKQSNPCPYLKHASQDLSTYGCLICEIHHLTCCQILLELWNIWDISTYTKIAKSSNFQIPFACCTVCKLYSLEVAAIFLERLPKGIRDIISLRFLGVTIKHTCFRRRQYQTPNCPNEPGNYGLWRA